MHGAGPATHRGAVELAEEILELLPAFTEHKVWFGHSGSDANETAIRAARRAAKRSARLASGLSSITTRYVRIAPTPAMLFVRGECVTFV